MTASPSRIQMPVGARKRGFTLAELMAVVVIVGILATLASVGYSKYILAAKSSEAVYMVNGIRAAEESYRAETLSYLNVSGSLDAYYPHASPGAFKTQWGGGSGQVADRWRVLSVTSDGPVYYGYAVIAGGPGDVVAPGLYSGFDSDLPVATEPWYIVQAMGNLNGDSIPSYYVASSFSNQGSWINEGE